MPSKKVFFDNGRGQKLAAKVELPLMQPPYPFAVFSHVFTGNKNLTAVRHISRGLTMNGIAVLRFDFTGLGESEGDFADTNFSTNVEDLHAASKYLADHYQAPSIIIGHSLGGAAAIFAGSQIDSISAIATIGAPSDPEHVSHLLASGMDEIEKLGQATIKVDGRDFVIKKQFLDDLKNKDLKNILHKLEKAILILHSPQDGVVEIENAAKIYHHAIHPKSFVTLNNADHMLSNKNDAFYTGNVIASWVKRYLKAIEKDKITTDKQVVARLKGDNYTTEIVAGKHGILADESEKVGGNDFGPSPYELLCASLGACTSMTIQMYARHQDWDIEEVRTHLSYQRDYAEDCENCNDKDRYLEKLERVIEIKGDLNPVQKNKLLEIADESPVYKTLKANIVINTKLDEDV